MKNTVFLCGPMRGLDRQESLGWRKQAVLLLCEKFYVLHAMRQREEKETLPDPRLAIARDKQDIMRADILLVNDSFPNASMIGTAMEILFAYQLNKTIIVFGDAHPNDYWLNYHCHCRVTTLQEACAHINQFFANKVMS